MKNTEVIRNYAEALFHVSQGVDIMAQVEVELGQLVDWMKRTPLGRIWHSPLVPKPEKRALAEELLAGRPTYLINFVCLLIERNRLDYLQDILEEFLLIRDRESHTLSVVVRTPFPLSKAQRAQVEQRLADLSGREVHLRVVEDAALIGGIRLLVHDRLLDGSVLAQLDALRQQMLAGLTR